MASTAERLQIVIDAQDRASAEIKKVNKEIENIKRTTTSVSKSVNATTNSMTSSFSSLKSTLIGLGVGYAIKSLATNIVNLAGSLEQTQVAFGTMLGSADKAKKLLTDLSDFAQKTPFELTGLRSTAKQLLAFGVSAEEMIPTLGMLGDVASGLSVPIEQVAYAYGQVRVANQLYGTELRQFMNAGIPLLGELAKMYGVTEASAKEMVEEGKIGFKDVEKAFQNMTSEGGRFHNMMDAQSKTFVGKVSNMKDSLNKMGETIGMAVLPMLTKLVDAMLPVVQKVSDWIIANQSLIEGIGSYLYDVLKKTYEFIVFFGEGITNLADLITSFVDTTLGARYRRKDEALGIFNTVANAVASVSSALPGVSLVTSAYSMIEGRATGGPVRGGTPYIVGENGPEMFVPSSSGSIVPNHSLGGISVNLGGVTIANGRDENYLVQMLDRELTRIVRNLSLGVT